MVSENLEERAEKTLRETDSYRVPVAIDIVAQRLNLTLTAGPLGEKVSGMLVVKEDRGAIGYNSAHPRVRQRFTIAHEIAHFLLHARGDAKEQLFIDPKVISRRDDNLSTRDERKEVEANKLGAALLIPKGAVQQEIRYRDLDLDDEEAIAILAKRFQVSTVTMAHRLMNLKILY
jgi:Zn-dependent peptidase ImmA (M78 family)